jgi:hypothetical protein
MARTTKSIPKAAMYVYDPLTGLYEPWDGVLNTGDIEIGAVEIKDGTTDTRGVVTSDGVNNAQVVMNSDYVVNLSTDSGDVNVTYVGKATVGATTASASWQIKQLDETTDLVMTYADGDNSYDNVWNNRESLSYS